MKFPKVLIPALVIIGAALIYFFFLGSSKKEQLTDVLTIVKKGAFSVSINSTGELRAKNSVEIKAPPGMRAAGIFESTISDLITEGTIVREGQYVASLDRTELANKISNVQTELDKIQTQLEQAKIDTAIEMRGLRDQLINLDFSKKEKELNIEQSRFEPQSVIRQAELELERISRDFSQLDKKYELKKQQMAAQIKEIITLQKQNQRQLNMYTDLSDQFIIKAPKDGMLIYARSWRSKKEPGSRVTAWDPVVAELPDLSDMITTIYVNEVDISKVRKGQEAIVKVDAFPDKQYHGQVIEVANIGEQLRGYDTKVFEVVVQVNETDSILRPAMTTGNEIITDIYDDVLFIPIEALQEDSLSFVYKKLNGKVVRQEIIPGVSNDNEIIIAYGLEENEEIYLTEPEKGKEAAWIYIPIEKKEEVEKMLKAERQKRALLASEKEKKVGNVDRATKSSRGGRGGIMIIN